MTYRDCDTKGKVQNGLVTYRTLWRIRYATQRGKPFCDHTDNVFEILENGEKSEGTFTSDGGGGRGAPGETPPASQRQPAKNWYHVGILIRD